MTITKRTRFEVLKRDNHTCRYCGGTAPDVVLTADHVIPVALGGSDDPSNLVAACQDCNAGKSSTNPTDPTVEDAKQEALRWSAAMKIAAERTASKRGALIAYCQEWRDEWDGYLVGSRIYDPVLPDDYQDSIEKFYKAGLPLSELKRALALSMSRKHIYKSEKFRYMAGICWSVLREMQDDARAIMREGDE